MVGGDEVTGNWRDEEEEAMAYCGGMIAWWENDLNCAWNKVEEVIMQNRKECGHDRIMASYSSLRRGK